VWVIIRSPTYQYCQVWSILDHWTRTGNWMKYLGVVLLKCANPHKVLPSGATILYRRDFWCFIPNPKLGSELAFSMQIKLLNLSKTVADSATVCMVSKYEVIHILQVEIHRYIWYSMTFNQRFQDNPFSQTTTKSMMMCCGQTVTDQCPYCMGSK